MKKLTQEYIENKCNEKGYKLINKSNRTIFIKDKYGYICSIIWVNFIKGGVPNKFHISNPYTIQNIKLWMETNAIGYELLSTEYKGSREKLMFKCPKGHEFEMEWHTFQHGCRCPICSGKQVIMENCIMTTAPWMMDLGISKEDAMTHTKCSGDEITVICPHCGKYKNITISNIYNNKSIHCSCNSEGISYSEKFIISLLDQLNIKYIRECKFDWSDNKRYDFYLKDYNTIIECHGIQHYESNHTFSNCGARTLQEEQENDKFKKEIALQNSIYNYIILDCRESNMKQIKNSILNSELNNLFDLNSIDWIKCEEFALSNKVKEVCDYWNNKEEWETTTDLANKFDLNISTIRRYLKKGTKLGWCDYNSKNEMKKVNIKAGKSSAKVCSKPIEIFKNGESLGIFPSCAELERQSEELFGVKLSHSKISLVCNNKKPQYKGFTFKLVNDN